MLWRLKLHRVPENEIDNGIFRQRTMTQIHKSTKERLLGMDDTRKSKYHGIFGKTLNKNHFILRSLGSDTGGSLGKVTQK